MKYYIVAGEASGDLHGSNLMKGLYKEDPEAHIRFWGGPLMDAVFHANEEGEGLVEDYRAGAVSALNAYNADPTDANWQTVVTAFIDGWAQQYQKANG